MLATVVDAAAALTAFRQELVLAGLVRRPTETGAVPPMVVEPRDGAPAPGELEEGMVDDEGLVVSITLGSGLAPPSNYAAAVERRDVVAVTYRSRRPADLRRATQLDAQIRRRLIRPETGYGYGFMLGGPIGTAGALWVLEAAVYGGMGAVARGAEAGYEHRAAWVLSYTP